MSATHTVPANKNTVTGNWTNGSANKISLAIFDNSSIGMMNYSGSTDAQAAAWAAASNTGGADAFHLGSHQFGNATCH